MEIKDYITKNLINLNWNILPQIFEENDVELTEEIEAYLRNTPENTNWNVFEGMGRSESGEESWPKLIHVINDSGWKMADDSDFSTFSEAYNFIQNKWEEFETISSDYIILKFIDRIVESDGTVKSDCIEWYEETVPYGTIHKLTEDSYRMLEDE